MSSFERQMEHLYVAARHDAETLQARLYEALKELAEYHATGLTPAGVRALIHDSAVEDEL